MRIQNSQSWHDQATAGISREPNHLDFRILLYSSQRVSRKFNVISKLNYFQVIRFISITANRNSVETWFHWFFIVVVA